MEIVFSARHAVISDSMKLRAERAVEKAAKRLGRAVDARVIFEQDGPTRRVEIVLHAKRQRSFVAEGSGRFFGTALAGALARLQAQLPKKDTQKTRTRKLATRRLASA